MKKQLGLLTLGMALCLVAPVVGQANVKSEPHNSEAIVTIGAIEPKLTIHNAPSIDFGTSDGKAGDLSANVDEALEVSSEGVSDAWNVSVKRSEFKTIDSDNITVLEDGGMGLSSGNSELTGDYTGEITLLKNLVVGTEKNSHVLKTTGKVVGNVKLVLGKDGAVLNIPSGEPKIGGTYNSQLTWTASTAP